MSHQRTRLEGPSSAIHSTSSSSSRSPSPTQETPHEAVSRRVPSRSWNEKDEAHRLSLHRLTYTDKRFNPPAPAVWKRLALVLLCVCLVWMAFSARFGLWERKRMASREAMRYAREQESQAWVEKGMPVVGTEFEKVVPARDEIVAALRIPVAGVPSLPPRDPSPLPLDHVSTVVSPHPPYTQGPWLTILRGSRNTWAPKTRRNLVYRPPAHSTAHRYPKSTFESREKDTAWSRRRLRTSGGLGGVVHADSDVSTPPLLPSSCFLLPTFSDKSFRFRHPGRAGPWLSLYFSFYDPSIYNVEHSIPQDGRNVLLRQVDSLLLYLAEQTYTDNTSMFLALMLLGDRAKPQQLESNPGSERVSSSGASPCLTTRRGEFSCVTLGLWGEFELRLYLLDLDILSLSWAYVDPTSVPTIDEFPVSLCGDAGTSIPDALRLIVYVKASKSSSSSELTGS